MFVETINKFRAVRKVQYLLTLFNAFVFALTIHPSRARAHLCAVKEAHVYPSSKLR